MTRRGNVLPALIVLALVGVLTISTTVALGGPASAEVTTGGCPVRHASPPHPTHLHRPPQTVTRSDRLIAIVNTNCGRFQIRLDARRAPITVNSFVFLVRSGFYRGLNFYRVVPDFVIQAGDPRGAGTGGSGYSTTEPPPRHFHFHLGAVAMAKTFADPLGWAGSIFFVVAGREGRFIPNEYAILGQVSAGMKTVQRIDALGTESERPRQVVRINWIKIRGLGRAG
jgi:peptidyl-prolyl cis-trans isomerase B (cyclophilin B)